jgi:hypothetical protein
MSAVNQEKNLIRQVPTGIRGDEVGRAGQGIAPWKLFSRAAKLEGLSKNTHKRIDSLHFLSGGP